METINSNFQKYSIFALKNYDKTAEKYQNYAPRGSSWDDLMGSDLPNSGECTIMDQIDIWDLTAGIRREQFFYSVIQKNDWKLSPRQLAKTLHTFINNAVFEYNIRTFKSMGFSESQARSCSTRFYIENYDTINSKMSELFIEALRETPYQDEYFI